MHKEKSRLPWKAQRLRRLVLGPYGFGDLYAGCGGFHLALRELGHRCVFACEIDEWLRELCTGGTSE